MGKINFKELIDKYKYDYINRNRAYDNHARYVGKLHNITKNKSKKDKKHLDSKTIRKCELFYDEKENKIKYECTNKAQLDYIEGAIMDFLKYISSKINKQKENFYVHKCNPAYYSFPSNYEYSYTKKEKVMPLFYTQSKKYESYRTRSNYYENKAKKLDPYFLLKCPKCNHQTKAKVIIEFSIEKNFHEEDTGRYDWNKKEYIPYDTSIPCYEIVVDYIVRCECGEEYSSKDCFCFNQDTWNRTLKSNYHIYIENDMIKLNFIDKDYYVRNETIHTKTYRTKIVLNMKTGRNYLLPTIDLQTKRKKHKHNNIISINSMTIPGGSYNIQKEDAIEIANAIYEYNKDKGQIPFDDYTKDISHSSTHFALKTLLAYNTNGFVSYDFMSNFNHLHRRYKFNIKVTKNKEIKNQLETKCQNKILKANLTKKEMQYYVKYIDYLNNNGSFEYTNMINSIDYLNDIKSVIKDTNNVQKILKLVVEDEVYLGSLKEIFTNELIKDLLKYNDENKVVNNVIKYIMKNGKNNIYQTMNLLRDTCDMYKSIARTFDVDLSGKIRFKEMHDNFSRTYNRLRRVKVNYIYQDEMQVLNDNIDGFGFKLAESNYKLTEIGSTMNICVGSYHSHVMSQECIIVYATKDNDYKACIEINPRHNEIVQIKNYYNNLVDEDTIQAVAKWANKNKIFSNGHDVDKKYRELFTAKRANKHLFSNYKIELDEVVPNNAEDLNETEEYLIPQELEAIPF